MSSWWHDVKVWPKSQDLKTPGISPFSNEFFFFSEHFLLFLIGFSHIFLNNIHCNIRAYLVFDEFFCRLGAYTWTSLNVRNREWRRIASFLLLYFLLKILAETLFRIEMINNTWSLSVELYGMIYHFEWRMVVEETFSI